MKICPTCETEYPDSERFCPRDGASLRARDPGSDLIGSVIAERYHVTAKLGEGGMGQVYLAEHLRMKRKSAVKVMHASMAQDTDALSRFNREASNACQIDHPNVAAIYDFGESAGGLVYLAMEYVDGQPLSRLIATHGALPVARVADIVTQIAAALDAAHRLAIVHRDLKPDNILVGTHHDGRDKIKLVDFGISKGARGDGQSVTQTGQVVGTPDYMSPEQLSGEIVDHRSDIYSLAIVAFNMLTGALPFQSHSGQVSMLMRLTEPPQRLIATRPDLPFTVDLQQALDMAMALDPQARHPSASAFAAAITEAARAAPAGATVTMSTPLATTLINAQPSGARPVTGAPSGAAFSISFPVPSGVPATELATIESRLAKAVGPIARVLVRRAAASAATREALIAMLAKDIEDASAQAEFTRSLRG